MKKILMLLLVLLSLVSCATQPLPKKDVKQERLEKFLGCIQSVGASLSEKAAVDVCKDLHDWNK